jgi:TnpA family transposase
MHNEVVKSDIHSTDAFGFSELVFGVSHLLGFSYAPRFKNLKRQRLYIFKSHRGLDRSVWKIKPTGNMQVFGSRVRAWISRPNL